MRYRLLLSVHHHPKLLLGAVANINIWLIYIYGGWSKFLLLETAILSQKKFTLAKLSPYPQKTFAGPYVGLYVGISGRKQELDKGHLSVWATIKIIVWRLHIHMGVLLFTVVLAHLLRPVLTLPHRNWGLTCLLSPGKQDITSQQFRPPSFQEKAVFRQALSKLSPNFRENRPT